MILRETWALFPAGMGCKFLSSPCSFWGGDCKCVLAGRSLKEDFLCTVVQHNHTSGPGSWRGAGFAEGSKFGKQLK